MKSKKDGGAKTKTGRLKANLLKTYYGNPAKDMKLICITGTTGKVATANLVHEILKAAGQPVAVLATEDELKVGVLHKFLATAWKAGANYVVVTAPAQALKKDVFYGLPVYVAALTDFVPAGLTDPTPTEFVADESTLFGMSPEYVILNRDDAHYQEFAEFVGTAGTVTYGRDNFANVQIIKSQLYKKGVEATLAIGGTEFVVASWLTGETAVAYMAAAAAIADALKVVPEQIVEGMANYETEE